MRVRLKIHNRLSNSKLSSLVLIIIIIISPLQSSAGHRPL
jgi:hypothetical protein